MKKYKVSIIGAGNGGRAFASYLAQRGHEVRLGFRTFRNIRKIFLTHKIISDGEIEGIFALDSVSNDYSRIIKNSDVILIVVPASAHSSIIKHITPFLTDNQVILLNPGRTWGAVEAYNIIRRRRPYLRIFVGETQTLLFTCRKRDDYGVSVLRVKDEVKCCFYPEYNNNYMRPVIGTLFPQLSIVDDIRVTSLNNIGAMVHPATVLLNSGAICRKQCFNFYRNGVNEQLGRVLEQIDAERCAIMEALHVDGLSYLEWAKEVYGVSATSMCEAFRMIDSYKTIGAPKNLRKRYLTEDVPTGLVPLQSIAHYLNIPTPTIDAVVHLVDTILGTNYATNGRTIENVNLPLRLIDTIDEILLPETFLETI